ncbi:trypsin-like peptidase domain-containing protein [Nonomuraea typhae]|uniref:trypsin-like peptidase domain-containing protein n=1 Tax=Nonomuraea typhae TaxID=2603600 RepID=UPI0012FCBF52|nr:trypsin-like peptidase domain-containing protein [Nonomuraea typhae]
MTDETRPTEGRTPSDYPEPQERPEFLPAGEQGADSWGDPSGRPRDTISFGEPAPPSFGNPSSGGEGPGASPYGGTSSYGGPSPYGGPSSYGGSAGSFGSPSGEIPAGGPSGASGPPAGNPSFGSPSGGSGPSFGSPSGEAGSAFGRPSGEVGPAFGSPSGETAPSFASPQNGESEPRFGSPSGQPSFGPPPYSGSYAGASYTSPPQQGDTAVYSTPSPFGGDAPPPPQHALGMGTGWAPPPPGPGGGAGGMGGQPRKMGLGTGGMIAVALAIALIASGLGSFGTYLLTRPSGGTDPSYSLGPVPSGATNRAPDSVAGVASRVLPSVVSLEVGNGVTTDGASGSGFLIKDGYVVTNNHVVAMAAKGGEIRIMFGNRKTTSGRIVGRDPGSDLAVVKPEETFGTPEITLGNSDQMVVGDPVIAIGSPLGLTGTVTTGIVSSLNRPVIAGDDSGQTGEEPAYISAIQTDAAINPGNSGGPLVNVKGEVIGVNSAIATLSRSASNQSGSIGLGFAIPVNQTRRVVQELITTGKAKRPKIGIVLDNSYRGQGVRIASEPQGGRQPVDASGPAGQAGLKAGDVILEIDGLRLQDGNELIALIRAKAPGSKITVKYERGGQERTATLTVVAEDTPTPSPS